VPISRSKRFILIHVPRTGGSSFVTSLDPALFIPPPAAPGDKFLSKILPFVPRPLEKVYLRPHETARKARRRLPREVFRDYSKIAFVRNPYSWLVSLYEVRRRGPRHRHHKTVAAMSGFAEYVDWEISRHDRFQHAYLTDRRGALLVDYLGRYERLTEDHKRICEILGLEPSALPRINRATQRDYREYYDEPTRERVAGRWARDLELFGYDFDGLVEDRFPLL
jgi:hypothetical protein